MKVIAFAGSNSKKSINKMLVEYAAHYLKSKQQVEVLDLNDFEMPIYSIDREQENGIPSLAIDFASKIDDSDILLISLAEHNGAYSVAFKNVFDWISRVPNRKAWGDKKIILLSAAPGPRGGAGVLDIAKNRFPFNGGNVIAAYSIPHFHDNFDIETLAFTNDSIEKDIKAILNAI